MRIKERCRNQLHEVFGFDEFDVATVTDDAPLFAGKGAIGDSLDAVEYIMALEDEFKIEIPDEVRINTVQEAVNYLESRIG